MFPVADGDFRFCRAPFLGLQEFQRVCLPARWPEYPYMSQQCFGREKVMDQGAQQNTVAVVTVTHSKAVSLALGAIYSCLSLWMTAIQRPTDLTSTVGVCLRWRPKMRRPCARPTRSVVRGSSSLGPCCCPARASPQHRDPLGFDGLTTFGRHQTNG